MTRSSLWRDAALPAGLFLLGTLEFAGLRPTQWGYGVAMEAFTCLLLVWRRRNAVVFGTIATSALYTIPWFGPQLNEASVPILMSALAVFGMARWHRDLRGLIGIALISAVLLGDYVFVDQRNHNWSDVIFVAALIAPPFVLGRITRKLAEQKDLLEQSQELVKREAVRAERDRIARELHDVIAHSVSAMVVQTAAAQDLVRTDPEAAAKVLSDVADTGRHALAETGRLLHVIRDDADELGLRPAPGLADLPALVEQFRASGLRVDLELATPLPALPAGVDVSAYRIVQEALTNALRYGADRTAAVQVSGTPTGLSIRMSNPSGTTTSSGSGLGLLGMAERVSVLGGELSHGLTADGRFELAATLPVGTP